MKINHFSCDTIIVFTGDKYKDKKPGQCGKQELHVYADIRRICSGRYGYPCFIDVASTFI